MHIIYIQIYITLLKWLLPGCVIMGNFFFTFSLFNIFLLLTMKIYSLTVRKKENLLLYGSQNC